MWRVDTLYLNIVSAVMGGGSGGSGGTWTNGGDGGGEGDSAPVGGDEHPRTKRDKRMIPNGILDIPFVFSSIMCESIVEASVSS